MSIYCSNSIHTRFNKKYSDNLLHDEIKSNHRKTQQQYRYNLKILANEPQNAQKRLLLTHELLGFPRTGNNNCCSLRSTLIPSDDLETSENCENCTGILFGFAACISVFYFV